MRGATPRPRDDADRHSILTGVTGAPYVETHDLSLVTREGPVFEHVDLTFRRDRLAAVVGRTGSGRSALLLTLAGRMRGWTGSVTVAGYDAASQTALLRDRTSLARISDLVDLEPRLTVAESITERALIDGMPLARAGARFATSCEQLGVDVARRSLVGDLSALDQTRLSVALATMRPAEVVFLDEATRGLDAVQTAELMAGLVRLVEARILVVVSVLEAAVLPDSADFHRLALPADPARPTEKAVR